MLPTLQKMGPEKHMKMDAHGKSTAKIQPLSGQHWQSRQKGRVSWRCLFDDSERLLLLLINKSFIFNFYLVVGEVDNQSRTCFHSSVNSNIGQYNLCDKAILATPRKKHASPQTPPQAPDFRVRSAMGPISPTHVCNPRFEKKHSPGAPLPPLFDLQI